MNNSINISDIVVLLLYCCVACFFFLIHIIPVQLCSFPFTSFVVIHIEIFLLLLGVLFSLSFMSSSDSLEKQRVHFTLILFNDSLLFVTRVVVVSSLLLVVIHIVILLSSPCLVSFLFMSYHIIFSFSILCSSCLSFHLLSSLDSFGLSNQLECMIRKFWYLFLVSVNWHFIFTCCCLLCLAFSDHFNHPLELLFFET